MTQSLVIGQSIRLLVNDDPNRVIEFDPNDILFVERFYNLVTDFRKQLGKYLEEEQELEKNAEKIDGIPVNMGERLEVIKETCGYIRSQIDAVFGAGTSTIAFGSSYNVNAFAQFFDGISPYLKKTRSQKIEKYIPPVQKPAKGKRQRK